MCPKTNSGLHDNGSEPVTTALLFVTMPLAERALLVRGIGVVFRSVNIEI